MSSKPPSRPGFPVRLTPTASAVTRGRQPAVPVRPLVPTTPNKNHAEGVNATSSHEAPAKRRLRANA